MSISIQRGRQIEGAVTSGQESAVTSGQNGKRRDKLVGSRA